jgi:acyl-CoA reductase-like NAD-dependent aldehyde dehydrogenase
MPPTNNATAEQPLLVAGRLVAAEASDDVINPATGEPIALCPLASVETAHEAVAAAAEASGAWGRESPEVRSAVLSQMADIVKAHADELAGLLSAELGIPARDAQGEVAMAGGFLRHRAITAPPVDTLTDDERQRVQVVRRPVGVVAAIVPWNAPLLIACEKIATAFAAGNPVVLKPSPLAALTLTRFGALVAEAIPAGVLNVIPGDDEVGIALTTHPDVAMVSFTGSTATGREIMGAAAPTLKRLSLELGGNDAAIVMPGADVDRLAAKLFQAAFYRSGQICAAVKRIYVHESDRDRLVRAMVQVAEATTVGDPFEKGVIMGPLSNRMQRDRVEALVADAVAAGGSLATGGQPLDRAGFFYAPTLVTGLQADTALVAEEQFGPALPVLGYADLDEAVDSANATQYGLGGSVWGADIEAAADIAGRLDAGSVWVNRHGLLDPAVPFGGFKQSGIGRSNGAVGLDAYCELKTISIAKPRPASAG